MMKGDEAVKGTIIAVSIFIYSILWAIVFIISPFLWLHNKMKQKGEYVEQQAEEDGFKRGKKQGALKELEFWNNEIQRIDALSDNYKDFNERIVESLNKRLKRKRKVV